MIMVITRNILQVMRIIIMCLNSFAVKHKQGCVTVKNPALSSSCFDILYMRNFFVPKMDDKGIGLNDKTVSGVKGVSLKELAAHTGLSQGTLSVVLNNTERASSIPQTTKERIFKAAREFNYRPNYL